MGRFYGAFTDSLFTIRNVSHPDWNNGFHSLEEPDGRPLATNTFEYN
jgi:hypothetical protein